MDNDPVLLAKALLDKELSKHAEEIEKNCKSSGGLTAESGLTLGFTPGSQWEIVKDLKGPSHTQGGIDLSIDNGRVMFSDGKTKYHAADGLTIQAKEPSLLRKLEKAIFGFNDTPEEKEFTRLKNIKKPMEPKGDKKSKVVNNTEYSRNWMDYYVNSKEFVTRPPSIEERKIAQIEETKKYIDKFKNYEDIGTMAALSRYIDKFNPFSNSSSDSVNRKITNKIS